MPAPEFAPRTHFVVPADEMVFDVPEPCPTFPVLQLEGIAATPTGDHYLITTLDRANGAKVRAYLGPTPEAIARRGLIMAAGLRNSADHVDTVTSASILAWLAEAWTAFHNQLAEHQSSPRLAGHTVVKHHSAVRPSP